MSILSKDISGFHEFKKQASFFLKEKIKTARLALTDVTPAQLLTEEATNGKCWVPDARTLGSISRAAFEVDDYWRIVEILHKRLSKFERKNWKASYNSLIVLEHLLTHGPESTAEEFQGEKDVIREMQGLQYIDEKGFNWGLAVRKKSERLLKLLEKGPVLKEERDRARKLTRGIQGFGSVCQRILQDSSGSRACERANSSGFNDREYQENQIPPTDGESSIQQVEKPERRYEDASSLESGKKKPDFPIKLNSFSDDQMSKKPEVQTSFKENVAPKREDLHKWDAFGESNPLLGSKNHGEQGTGVLIEDDHPFSSKTENQTTASLLSARDGILQGC